jgi:copper chaperone CopZ
VANFSWIEPARPYLIGISILVLGFAWYFKLKPAKTNNMDCNCEIKKPTLLQSKTFLSVMTVFAALMMVFPLYAGIFNPKPKIQSAIIANTDNKKQIKFIIQGMTCAGCEVEVNNELSKVNGVLAYKTSYADKSSLVTYNATKVNVKEIQAAIGKTGYTVKGYEMVNATSVGSDKDSICSKNRSCTDGAKSKSCCQKN